MFALPESTGHDQVIILGSEMQIPYCGMHALLVAAENLTPWMLLPFTEAVPTIVYLINPERQYDAVIEARPLSLNLNCVTC